MQDQTQLVEVHLELQKAESLPRHLNVELVFDVLGDLGVLQARHIMHGLKYDYVVAVVLAE